MRGWLCLLSFRGAHHDQPRLRRWIHGSAPHQGFHMLRRGCALRPAATAPLVAVAVGVHTASQLCSARSTNRLRHNRYLGKAETLLEQHAHSAVASTSVVRLGSRLKHPKPGWRKPSTRAVTLNNSLWLLRPSQSPHPKHSMREKLMCKTTLEAQP